ncbi:arsinothricin resistance N-acetyltransferase ArsN1 family A [Deinococcus sp. QL22]|uniref:arsinothricin resistance N-acetyltransferase ArsN1 family A n=1 Tax=Deinococcus sp. QL22 TaxID=2939437 RepID=UPI0020177C52|nr:arsinothricin resistance N-acetyltransferase ArsN1 family A [Deinococcus sp. QL22]UQN04988.1 arsinothricin resistance N-acetyltransferase ArsN1 [Deinococcus sp. QL22]
MPARPATLADAPAIAQIYNEGIEDRIATFETQLRTPDDIRERLSSPLAAQHPAVVISAADSVVAFAWSGSYSAREVYAGIGDHGVYVARAARGQGYGEAALRSLMAAATVAGLHKLTSRILTENTASRRLHTRCGFREVGVHQRHAQLDGLWHDVVTVEVLL